MKGIRVEGMRIGIVFAAWIAFGIGSHALPERLRKRRESSAELESIRAERIQKAIGGLVVVVAHLAGRVSAFGALAVFSLILVVEAKLPKMTDALAMVGVFIVGLMVSEWCVRIIDAPDESLD
jgi:hypothetical protein